MADRRTKIILGLDAGPYVRGLAAASTATKAFVKDLDSSNDRMSWLVQSSLALGPALVPIGAAAVPAVAALTTGLGAAAGAAVVAAVAFNGVGDGLKALNEYQLEPSAANLAKVKQALEDLGPAGADFVMFLDSLGPKLDKLQNTARAGLFPGVEDGIRSLMERAPQVNRIIAELSGALGDLASEAGEGLSSDKFDDFFDYIEHEARPILTDMGRTLGNVTEGIANMLVEFDPLSDMFSNGLLGMSRDFAAWSRDLENNEGFQSFVDYVQRVSPKAMDTLGAIALALADIVEAAAPVGEITLPIIKGLAQVIGTIADSNVGPILIGAAAGLSAVSRAVAVFNAANGSALVGLFKKSREEGGKLAGTADRLSGAFSGTGALVGGIGLTALAFTDLDEKVGLSNTAMGAMLGSVAGPWGAAIGGGIGLVKDFAAANDDLEDAAKRVDSIMGGTDATGIVSSLSAQQKGAADAADNYDTLDKSINFVADGLRGAGPLGISMGESLRFLSDEASNSGDSIKALVSSATSFANLARFDSALRGGSLTSYGKDVGELEQSLVKAEPVLRRFGYTVEDVLSGNLSDSEMRQLAAATRHYLRTIDSAPGRAKAMGAALRDLNDPMATAEESSAKLAASLDAVFTPALTADEAMQARIESLRALDDQLRKTNGQFGFQTKATMASRTAIRDHISAIATEAKAMAERGDGTRKISRYLREQRKDLLRAFPKEARDEAQRLIDRTFRYGEIIRGLPKRADTKVDAPGAKKAIEEFTTLFGWIEKTPDKKSTKTDAPGVDGTKKDFDALNDSVRKTPDQKKVDTSAPGATRARDELNGVDKAVREIDGKTVNVTLSAQVKNIMDSINDVFDFADGAVLDFNANGDIKDGHVAQIAPAGSWRVWAEPETGGEAYIPFAESKRARSLDIWRETGRRLGVEPEFFADGAVRADTRMTGNPLRGIDRMDRMFDDIVDKFGEGLSTKLEQLIRSMGTGFNKPLPNQYGPSGTWGSYASGGSHPALDWPAPSGTPIEPVFPGKVMHTTSLGDSYGNYTEVKHGKGLTSLYAHQTAFKTSAGETVMPGQTMGLVGSTGNSTGPHLHLELQKNGTSFDYTSWIKGGGPIIGGPGGVYEGDHSGLDRASPSKAQAYARSILGRHGWPETQWPYWLDLGNRESGWQWNATNPSSGAYGIPQALPASKLATAGSDWRTNAGTQVDWMANYIEGRYDGPHGAINWHDAHNWYADGALVDFFNQGGFSGTHDSGGWVPNGGLAYNASGGPEAFLNTEDSTNLRKLLDSINIVIHKGVGGPGQGGGTPDLEAIAGLGVERAKNQLKAAERRADAADKAAERAEKRVDDAKGKAEKAAAEKALKAAEDRAKAADRIVTQAEDALAQAKENLANAAQNQQVLDKALKGFDLEPNQTGAEMRQEFRDLLAGVRESMGKNSDLYQSLQRFRDGLIDSTKRLDEERAERDKIREQLKATRQASNQYGNTVAGTFKNDPFTGGLDEYYLQLNADKNDSRRGKRLQRRAERLGLDGPLAKAILASGNIDLLAELVRGGRSEIRKAEQAYESRNQAANAFGDSAALQVYGKRLDKLTVALGRREERIDRLTQRLEKFEDRVGDRVERGARKGIRDRDKDKNNLLQQVSLEARG